jgi:5-methylcytosine-specific restriction enzyme A
LTARRNHRSAEAIEYRRWYKTARWQGRRIRQLQREPLCEMCKAKGLIVEANTVDHKIPHRGDGNLFWYGELQSLCKPHHDRDAQVKDILGYYPEVGEDGYPVDPRHPFNRSGV